MMPQPNASFGPLSLIFAPTTWSVKLVSPYSRLMKGASGKYAGEIVKVAGAITALNGPVGGTVRVDSTIPGKMLPTTEPMPGKLDAAPKWPLLPDGVPIWLTNGGAKALPVKPKFGPVAPINGNCREGCPPCNVGGQPFRPVPLIGAPGPNFGLTGNAFAPPFVSQIGTPSGSNGHFGAASNFPGMGSVVGSILPGIVLSTRTVPPTGPFNAVIAPATFTISPAYLPEAPFINRLYGETSFTDHVVGAKIRLSGPNDALGWGIIPFYRWWPDKAKDFKGFNQLQRGAGAGGDIGDFGLIGFVAGRLSQHVNVSANLGYILNSNPKSEAMNDAVLLDRPDEF